MSFIGPITEQVGAQPENEILWNDWIELNQQKVDMVNDDHNVTFYIDHDKAPPLNILIYPASDSRIDRVDRVDVKVNFYESQGVGLLSGPDWAKEWLEIPLVSDDNHPQAWIKIEKNQDGFITKIRLYDIYYPVGGGRNRTFTNARFLFKINQDESLIYCSPLTKINSLKTKSRKKGKILSDTDRISFLTRKIVKHYRIQNNWNSMHLCLTHDFIGDSHEINGWIENLTLSNLFKLISAKDGIGSNPFMSSVFYGKARFGVKVLELLKKPNQRREIVMNLNIFGSNVLHVAASRGNLEFLQLLKARFSSWGLSTIDIIDMLRQTDVHGATPIEMAYFQYGTRGRNTLDVINVLSIWMCELGLEVAPLPEMYHLPLLQV